MSDDNFGPWIDWAANGQPPSDLASAIAYQAKDREGQIYTSTRLSEIYWGEIKDGTIIAYRVRLPAGDLLRQVIEALTNSCDLLESYIDTFGDMSGSNRADLDDYRAVLTAYDKRGK